MGVIKDERYYEYNDDEQINTITLGEGLTTPPHSFSSRATSLWQADMEAQKRRLEGSLVFNLEGFDGPYNIHLDFFRKDQLNTLSFDLTSEADEGKRIINIDASELLKFRTLQR